MSEERLELRALLATSPNPIFVTSVSGTVLEANEACLELLGIDPDLLESVEAPDFYADPGEWERFRRVMERDGSVTGWETEMQDRDGRLFPARIHAAVRIGRHGVPVGFTGFIEDTTREKEAQRALREAEIRYRSLVDHNPYPVFNFDEKGRFVEVNDATVRLLGRDESELFGQPFRTVVHPDSLDEAHRVFRRALEGHATTYEVTLRHREGHSLVVEGVTVPVMVDGGIVGIQGVARDVTEQRRTRVELEERTQSFQSLFDSVTEAIYIQDAEGRFLDVNQAALEMYGYTREEMVGSGPEILACAGQVDLDATREQLRAALAGKPQYFEWWGRRRNGECFPKEVSLTRGRFGGKDVIIAVARDVSRARRLELQLREAQKMEAVGRLAGGVAHDFNNVLTAIQGHAELALEDAGPDHPLQADLREIQANSQRAASLVRQLLAFSRRQVLRPEVLDPASVIADLRTMLTRLIPTSILLDFRLDDALWPVKVDRSQMEQVILNLVLNARDAMPRGGRLEVVVGNRELSAQEAESSPHEIKAGRWVCLSVKDEGSGMDDATLARVFEPFFTTKAQGEGTGLGLATVYGIVRQSGGSIHGTSALDVGTTFEIMLPAAGDGGQPSRRDPEGVGKVGTGTVLVCEGEPAVRELARRALARFGYQVLEAGRGLDAIRVAEDHDGPVDLLLVDSVLTEASGREIYERIRRRRPEMRVLLMGGFEGEDDERTVTGAPLPNLRKPFSPTELVDRVRSVLT